MRIDMPTGTFWNADTFDAMRELPDNSVDMLLVDLPYGTTACKWDSIIPLEPLWKEYNRICKERAAMVFTATQPFTTTLIASNMKSFKYSWVWKKSPVNFLNAKKQPLRLFEDVLVFCKGVTTYNPQGLVYKPRIKKGRYTEKSNKPNGTETNRKHGSENFSEFTNYPNQLLDFTNKTKDSGLHPTQKPVALFEYLIKTYTNEGDTVLDNTAGSGTTGVAAHRTGRRWVCIERDPVYYGNAVARLLGEIYSDAQ